MDDFAKPEYLRQRLIDAEKALLNAMMGVMEPVAAYCRKYPQPIPVNGDGK